MEEGGFWERVSGIVTDNSIAVRNLTKGKNYRFRVAAVNMIGTSEWGETKSSVLAKNPYGKQNIDIRRNGTSVRNTVTTTPTTTNTNTARITNIINSVSSNNNTLFRLGQTKLH